MIFLVGEPRLVDPVPLRSKNPSSVLASSLALSTVGNSSGRNEVRERDENRCIMSGFRQRCDVCHLLPSARGDTVSYLVNLLRFSLTVL